MLILICFLECFELPGTQLVGKDQNLRQISQFGQITNFTTCSIGPMAYMQKTCHHVISELWQIFEFCLCSNVRIVDGNVAAKFQPFCLVTFPGKNLFVFEQNLVCKLVQTTDLIASFNTC